MKMKECTIAEIQHLVTEYLEGLSSPFDSFLEDHILSSTFYRIQTGSDDIGYFAIHDKERLTQFYIRRAYQSHAQQLFLQVIERRSVKHLFVPTCDELFVSLAVDQDFAMKKQAYFFQDSLVGISARLGDGELFRLAAQDDLQQIQQVCGDFLDDYESWMARGALFVYCRNADLLGIGLVEMSKMVDKQASIGMFTNDTFRKQGVGKTIIVQLRDWCNQNGITPVSGCWYYNEASRRTLESGGMVTRTRLLNIEVTLEKDKTVAE
ncbi:GNAT family N-acetyltransferase [Paenibacillus sp. LHD-117]|uniref:GNAT family N-acetyltransferase n=1 Tax=Paenibacillus sp. LHD-117 TaxID=3071412 RepID=UPI0027E17959|nr:GNAT family N-acetyltransferase [Paenibacillus sp. LHD-117]MDQ6422033.1 GNAT family N-acetyltransferase [Paenibacillus sp. LHD-117]